MGVTGRPIAAHVPTETHVARPRLVRALDDARIALVEAGGGYGKSTLAAELAGELGIATAFAELTRPVDTGALVLGELRRAFRRAGLSDIAASIEAGEGAGLESLIAALGRAPGPVLLVVDDAQHARGEAARLVVALGEALPERHRLVVLMRVLSEPLAGLEPGAVVLRPSQLAFTSAETEDVLAAIVGRSPTAAELAAVVESTGGWPAAVVLAAGRTARSPQAPFPASGRASVLGELVDGILAPLGEARRLALAQLGRLPLVSPAVADAVSGSGSLEEAQEAGLPFTRRHDGWLEVPEPVREVLAERVELQPETARRAARALADSGELSTALVLLLHAGDGSGAAALLAGLAWQDLAALDIAEAQAALALLPGEVVDEHPRTLVELARVAAFAAASPVRSGLLLRALAAAPDAAPLRREVLAELALDHARDGAPDNAEQVAHEVLRGSGPDEGRARGRALTALGLAAAFRGDSSSLRVAEERLAEAAAVFALVGEREWRADALAGLGYRVCFARGDLLQASRHLHAALGALPGATRTRARIATFLADVDVYCGNLDEAEAELREAIAIGRTLGDHRLQAYAAWVAAKVASLRGSPAAVVERLKEAERHPGDWFDHPTGIEFLAEGAELLARLGDERGAREYEQRARHRAEEAGYPEIGWFATGVVEARFGDPAAAEEALVRFAASPQQQARDEWRTLLFRAYAAQRRGAPEARELAERAREGAAGLGLPELPALCEPDVARALAGNLGEDGAALRAPTYVVSLLGAFSITADGRPVDAPPGHVTLLVKLVALRAGPVAADEVIEVLWPEVDGASGRRRLRNLLNRVRAQCGDIVVRDGDALRLAPSATVDAMLFEAEVAAAFAAPADDRPGLARTALARYAGDLLPEDRYEPWATSPRERLRRRVLDILDLLAEDAIEREEVDEAIRLLDRALEAEPLDESRYLRSAELLLLQGRRGGARALVERAAAIREELGLPESTRLARLRSATQAR